MSNKTFSQTVELELRNLAHNSASGEFSNLQKLIDEAIAAITEAHKKELEEREEYLRIEGGLIALTELADDKDLYIDAKYDEKPNGGYSLSMAITGVTLETQRRKFIDKLNEMDKQNEV